MSEHAVIIYLSLDSPGFGTQEARDQVRALERCIEIALADGDVGELDGDTFGVGEAMIFLYGRDADRLFAAVEPALRSSNLRPAHAVLRYGEVDDANVVQRRVEL